MLSACCLIVISQEFRWLYLGFLLEANLLFVSQKTVNTKFQEEKEQPSEENTSDPSGKVHFSELPYIFSSFKIKLFPWFSFLECGTTVLLEMGSFSFSFGIDPPFDLHGLHPWTWLFLSWRGKAQVCITLLSQPGFLWREAWNYGCEAVGGVSTSLGLEAWSSSFGAELGAPLAAVQEQLSVWSPLRQGLQDSGIFQWEETVPWVILLPLNRTPSRFCTGFTLGSVWKNMV